MTSGNRLSHVTCLIRGSHPLRLGRGGFTSSVTGSKAWWAPQLEGAGAGKMGSESARQGGREHPGSLELSVACLPLYFTTGCLAG